MNAGRGLKGPNRMSTLSPDLVALKDRLKATWMAGDYAEFSRYLRPGALEILRGWNIPAGARMLDVGCGAGQIAIPASAAGVRVTGLDIATNLVEHARAEARRAGVDATFIEGDAEELPFPDGSFDVVVSLIGAMFAPRPERVASELLRVCRSGGRILMANWTPRSFVGDMFRTISKYVPPPPGVPPAGLWGDEETVRARLGPGCSAMTLTRKLYPSFVYPFGPREVADWFLRLYGPTRRAFEAVGPEKGEQLRAELEAVFAKFNRGTAERTEIEGEYLDVDCVRG
jgi:SAM-dependent methyltransferase